MHEKKLDFLHGCDQPAPLNQKKAHSQWVSLAGIAMCKDLCGMTFHSVQSSH